ncbi:MAG: DUF4159 domain-containing protein [Planctomycetota bacterium]|jgi:hypothetical protein
MNRRRSVLLLCAVAAATAVSVGVAQWRGGRYRDRSYDRAGVPEWENDPEFAEDVFTFVRIRYSSYGGYGYRRHGGGWATDWRASDLNFSFRLQQLTSLKVNPEPIILELTDPKLFDYPFIYIVEPGALSFSEAEVKALRHYLYNGGFLMVDDFWGEDEWYNFYMEIRRVFPNRELQELPLEHQIFHCVYDLKKKPQIPSIGHAQGGRHTGRTWERYDAETPHYKAIHDDDGRMMVIICHNTDLGDGWEREGEDPWFSHEFSEKYAYPLGINIVMYAMTH